MKFGIFDHVERRTDVPLNQQFSDRLELVAQADRSGFYCYHVAEHHHSPLSMASSPALYLSAMSLMDESLAISTELGMRPLMERVLSRRDILKA